MVIYLELIYIYNVFLMYNIILLSDYLLNIKHSLKRRLILSISLSLPVLLLPYNISNILIIIYTISILYSITKYKKLYYIIIFYFITFSLGGIYDVIYIIYFNKLIYILVTLPIIDLLIYIIISYIKESNENLYYETYFIHNNIRYDLLSYLDTGNVLCDNSTNIPVIFIKHTLNITTKPKIITFNLINNTCTTNIYLIENFYIRINNKYIRKQVFISFDNNIKYEALLNKHLIY